MRRTVYDLINQHVTLSDMNSNVVSTRVAHKQQSMDQSSTGFSDDDDKVVAVWLRTSAIASKVNVESVISQMEHTVGLFKPYEDAPDTFLLRSVHDLPAAHSVYVYGEADSSDVHIRHAQLPMTIFKQIEPIV